MATTPMVVVAKNELPVATFAEFVTYLKANGDKLNYGSGGAGAQSHLTCAYLNSWSGPNRSTSRFAAPGRRSPR